MSRTSLSSWRTLVWGRGTLLFFAGAGSARLLAVTFAPSRFDWGGEARPWYALVLLWGLLAVGVWIVHRVVGSLQPVSVDADQIFVSRWFGEEVYPKRALESAFINRASSVVGQKLIVLALRKDGRLKKASFFVSEEVDRDDLGELLGKVVSDPGAPTNGRSRS